jgi:hypothetical protein
MGEVAEKWPVGVVVSKGFTNVHESTFGLYCILILKCYMVLE